MDLSWRDPDVGGRLGARAENRHPDDRSETSDTVTNRDAGGIQADHREDHHQDGENRPYCPRSAVDDYRHSVASLVTPATPGGRRDSASTRSILVQS
jgi:hypothetical protein